MAGESGQQILLVPLDNTRWSICQGILKLMLPKYRTYYPKVIWNHNEKKNNTSDGVSYCKLK